MLKTATSVATIHIALRGGRGNGASHDAGKIGDGFDAAQRQHDRDKRNPQLGRDGKNRACRCDAGSSCQGICGSAKAMISRVIKTIPSAATIAKPPVCFGPIMLNRPMASDRDDRPQAGGIDGREIFLRGRRSFARLGSSMLPASILGSVS